MMIHWISPAAITRCLRVELSIQAHKDSVIEGDWDLDVLSFEETDPFCGEFRRHLAGTPWEETEYFQRNVALIESGTPKWHCRTREDFLARCHGLDAIYASMKEFGFIQNGDEDCISVALDRHGRPLFCNGRHRLTFAKLLGIPSVPVRIIARHRLWVEFCAKVDAYAKRNSGKLYAPIDHIDLADRPAFHRGRTQFILENMLPSSRTVLDIGSHWGYLPTRLERTGRHCVAVEQSPEQLFFLNTLRKANDLSFDVVSDDIFNYVGSGKQFDTVLALAIFHHFLKTRPLHDALANMLRNLEMEELFLLTHSQGETQMQGAHANYSPAEFAQFIVDNSCLDTITPLASFNGRVLYRIGKQANEATYPCHAGDFRIVFFAFIGAALPQILDKVNGQFRGLRSCHPNSVCVVMGTGSDALDMSRYDFEYIDLRRFPNGEADRGRIAESVLRRLQPDVVYMRYPIADEHLAHLARTIPNMVFEHQSKELEELVHSNPLAYFKELALGAGCLHRAAGVVGVTDEIASYERRRAGGHLPSRTMGNGIAPDAHPLSAQPPRTDTVEALVIADFRYWHGLDRLIAGCAANPAAAAHLRFHVVGFGPAIEQYRTLAESSGCSDRFVFHGPLASRAIDPLADRCAFAVGVLAPSRKRLDETSALKHREYALRGLPFAFAGNDTDFSPSQAFCHVVPDNETPIDMDSLLAFARQAVHNPALRLHAREFALQHLNWAAKMKIPVALCRQVLAMRNVAAPPRDAGNIEDGAPVHGAAASVDAGGNGTPPSSAARDATTTGIMHVNGQTRKAMAFFRKAQEEMAARNFPAASSIMSMYRSLIAPLSFPATDKRRAAIPDVSIVIVAYRTEKLLLDCIHSVLHNTDRDYEIIVVDNGGNESVHQALHSLPLLHIVAPDNLILSEGRNVGAQWARGHILAFLDDDALVPPDYVASIRAVFRADDVLAIRGKVLPKTPSPNNAHAAHYDLGDKPFPSLINTEGNSAFLREPYLALQGMDPLLFGHEGTELGYRMLQKYGGTPQWYMPNVVIHHDFAETDQKLHTKLFRHETMWNYLHFKHKDMEKYLALHQALRQAHQCRA